MERRKRRRFTKACKAEVMELVRKSGKSIGAVAKDLDLTETALREWVRQGEVDAGRGSASVALRRQAALPDAHPCIAAWSS